MGAGDQVILFGYAGGETGKTKVRSLMIGLDAGSETATLYELKLGEVVPALRTSVGVETVQCEDLGFTVWGVKGQLKIHPLWRHFCQGPRCLTNVVKSTDLNKNVDAEEEIDNLVRNEIPDTVVLALANTLTPSVATLSGQKLSDVCM